MIKGFSWLSFLFLVFVFACNSGGKTVNGNGIIVEEERALEQFSAIEMEGNYTLELEQGDPRVVIQTDSNLLSYIQTEVSGNTLRLTSKENPKGSNGITIRISYPELERLQVGGAGSISNSGVLKARELEIEVNGAAELNLAVEIERKLELELKGASSVELSGTAQQLDTKLSGAGNLSAYELQVRDASISVSGVGGAEVYVTDNLQAKVSGVGGISYRGEPQNIQRQVSGVGSISAASAAGADK